MLFYLENAFGRKEYNIIEHFPCAKHYCECFTYIYIYIYLSTCGACETKTVSPISAGDKTEPREMFPQRSHNWTVVELRPDCLY